MDETSIQISCAPLRCRRLLLLVVWFGRVTSSSLPRFLNNDTSRWLIAKASRPALSHHSVSDLTYLDMDWRIRVVLDALGEARLVSLALPSSWEDARVFPNSTIAAIRPVEKSGSCELDSGKAAPSTPGGGQRRAAVWSHLAPWGGAAPGNRWRLGGPTARGS